MLPFPQKELWNPVEAEGLQRQLWVTGEVSLCLSHSCMGQNPCSLWSLLGDPSQIHAECCHTTATSNVPWREPNMTGGLAWCGTTSITGFSRGLGRCWSFQCQVAKTLLHPEYSLKKPLYLPLLLFLGVMWYFHFSNSFTTFSPCT